MVYVTWCTHFFSKKEFNETLMGQLLQNLFDYHFLHSVEVTNCDLIGALNIIRYEIRCASGINFFIQN